MTDSNELEALKASYRGAVRTADALGSLRDRLEELHAIEALSDEELRDLARLTAAHAVASAALRGLVETIVTRRGGVTGC